VAGAVDRRPTVVAATTDEVHLVVVRRTLLGLVQGARRWMEDESLSVAMAVRPRCVREWIAGRWFPVARQPQHLSAERCAILRLVGGPCVAGGDVQQAGGSNGDARAIVDSAARDAIEERLRRSERASVPTKPYEPIVRAVVRRVGVHREDDWLAVEIG